MGRGLFWFFILSLVVGLVWQVYTKLRKNERKKVNKTLRYWIIVFAVVGLVLTLLAYFG